MYIILRSEKLTSVEECAGMVAIAIVLKNSSWAAMDDGVLHDHCKRDGCIIDAEEYALELKTRVIQKFIDKGNKEIVDREQR